MVQKAKMSFTDDRLPGKTYKTEKGLKSALTALAKRNAAKKELETVAQAPVAQITALTHIRNVHGNPVRIRLHDESKGTSRNIRLSARGQRGDIMRVSDSERESNDYMANLFVLFEPIDTNQATNIMGNQTHNQQAVHPALAGLTDPNGNLMHQQNLVVEPEYNKEQSFVVAREDRDVERTISQQTLIKRVTGPVRAQLPGTEDRPAESYMRGQDSEMARLMAADAAARQKGEQGLDNGLGGFTVKSPGRVMDPTMIAPNQPVRGSETYNG
jgi:hypothetical protein